MIWKPNATVAVICERDGKFLVVEELTEGKKVINQPAGHIDEGELILTAAAREALEETGYTVEITHFIGLFSLAPPNSDTTYYRFCFAATALERITTELDDGIIQALWLSRGEILDRHEQLRSPLVIECIDAYIAGELYPLSILHEQHRYPDQVSSH
jgi:8-oxo-dGTP pyrophosphatase MutT (NUDIX family)